MKKDGKTRAAAAWLLFLLILPFCAGAEVLGFGFVNDRDVAIRREPGGKTVGRLPEDTCVWILDSREDKKGALWYRINAGVNRDHANLDYTGWMMAKFVDAGETLWHDVIQVSAMGQGMIAVRSDGTAEAAGRPVVSAKDGGWVCIRGRAAASRPVAEAACYWANAFAFVTDDGRIHGVETEDDRFIDDRVRLLSGYDLLFALGSDGRLKCALRDTVSGLRWIRPESEPDGAAMARVVQIVSTDCRVLMRTDGGEIWAAGWSRDDSPVPEPDWSTWTDAVSLAAGRADFRSGEPNQMMAAAVRSDGTVTAYPEALLQAIGGWTDLADVQLSAHGALGLRRDGTVVSAGWNGYPAMDVSGWTDIAAVSAADDYCVGLRRDGTLVFAGSHVFMRDGHNRK